MAEQRRGRRSVPPEDDYGTDEETPRRSRRSVRDEESPPQRRRRGFAGPDNMDTDDEPDDETYADDDDEDTPRRSRRSERVTRTRGDREERTTRPKRPSRGSDEREQGDRRALRSANMKSYRERVAETSLKYRRYEVKGSKEQPFAFLEPEPFAHFYRHWVPIDGKRRPYVCLGDICPLCALADRAKPTLMWNIYDFADDQVKVWEMSKEPAQKVEKRYDALKEKKKTVDDPGVFFTVSKSRTGGDSGGAFVYDVQRITPDDLEDLGYEELSDDELDDLKLYDDSIVYIHSLSDLQDVADKVQD